MQTQSKPDRKSRERRAGRERHPSGLALRVKGALRWLVHTLTRDFMYDILRRFSTTGVWFLFAGIYLAVYLSVGISMELLYHGQPFISITYPAEMLNGFNVFVLLLPSVWAFYRWLPEAAFDAAGELEAKGILRPVSVDKTPSQSFSQILKDSFNHRLVYILALITCVIASVYTMTIGAQTNSEALGLTDFWYYKPIPYAILSVIFVHAAYAFFVLIFRLLALVVSILRYFRNPGVIQALYPLHPDHCGGMGGLGKIASRVVILAAIIAMWMVIYAYYPTLNGGGLQVVTMAILGVVYSILAPVILLLQIVPPHRSMVAYRYKLLEDISAKIQTSLMCVVDDIDAGDIGALAKESEEVKKLTELQAQVANMLPTWPISLRVLRGISVPAISPIVLSLIPFTIDLVQALMK